MTDEEKAEAMGIDIDRIAAIEVVILEVLDEADAEHEEAIPALLGAAHGLAEEIGRGAADMFASALLVACGDDVEKARAALDHALVAAAVGEAVLENRAAVTPAAPKRYLS